MAEVAEQEGIGKGTLYNWLTQAKEEGVTVPGSGKTSEQWSAESKFAVVVETASKNESELSEYCRSKGLYPEQVKAWRQACIEDQPAQGGRQQREQAQAKRDKKKIKTLKRELDRKEKALALAKAAALLILRKKVQCPVPMNKLTEAERAQVIGYVTGQNTPFAPESDRTQTGRSRRVHGFGVKLLPDIDRRQTAAPPRSKLNGKRPKGAHHVHGSGCQRSLDLGHQLPADDDERAVLLPLSGG